MIEKSTLDLLGTLAQRDLSDVMRLLLSARDDRDAAERSFTIARERRERLEAALQVQEGVERARGAAGIATVRDLIFAERSGEVAAERLRSERELERAAHIRLERAVTAVSGLEASLAKLNAGERTLDEYRAQVRAADRVLERNAEDEAVADASSGRMRGMP